MLPIIIMEFLGEARTVLSLFRAGAVALEEGTAAGITYASENVSAITLASMIIKRYESDKANKTSRIKMVESEDAFFFLANRALFRYLSTEAPTPIISDKKVDELTLHTVLSPAYIRTTDDVHQRVTAFMTVLNHNILSLDPELSSLIGRAVDHFVDRPIPLDFINDYLSNDSNIQSFVDSLSNIGYQPDALKFLCDRLKKGKYINPQIDVLLDQYKSDSRILSADTWIGLIRGAFIRQASFQFVVGPDHRPGKLALNIAAIAGRSSYDATIAAELHNYYPIATPITNAHIKHQEDKILRHQGWNQDLESKRLVPPSSEESLSVMGSKWTNRDLVDFAFKYWTTSNATD